MRSTRSLKTASVMNHSSSISAALISFLILDLPAGILQGAFFESDRPKYLNYGAIGTVIGHEIIHGYDDKGRQYDKNGNLLDWWEDKTNQDFIKRAQCFVDQYGNFTDKQVKMHVCYVCLL